MWVNGFNLGRYWNKGPQRNFYIPAPLLKTGSNEVVMLELERGVESCEVAFADKPDFSSAPAAQCDGAPKAGDVLRMQSCDSSLPHHMAWDVEGNGSAQRLALGGLCLGSGPAKDAQSGQPSATLIDCGEAVNFTVSGNQISHNGMCLDITANGQTPGERVEWYACQRSMHVDKNQLWDLRDTPAHTKWVVSQMDGKCLTACSKASLPRVESSLSIIV